MGDSSRLVWKFTLLVAVACLSSCGHSGSALPGPWTLDVVYATNRGSNTISAYQVNPGNGALTPVAGSPYAAGSAPTGPLVVANGFSGFVANGSTNSVSAFRIGDSGDMIVNSTGALLPLTGSPLAAGTLPVALATDFALGALYVINQGDDSISVYKGNSTMSSLATVPGSPFATGTGPSAVTLGSAVYVVNHGSNSVSAYAVDPNSDALSPVAGSPFATGNGPTKLAIDSNLKFAFVANNGSANVSAYRVGAGGTLTEVAGSPFAAGTNPVSASIWSATGPSEFVYVLNGGSNSVSAFSVDATSGVLAPVAGSPFATGNGPTSLAIDPTGRFVYVTNGGSGSVSGYAVDGTTGALTPLAGSPYPCGTGPRSLTFDNAGNFVYVANGGSGDISGFAISAVSGLPDTGALTPVPGSPFASGVSLDAVTTLTIKWSPYL